MKFFKKLLQTKSFREGTLVFEKELLTTGIVEETSDQTVLWQPAEQKSSLSITRYISPTDKLQIGKKR